MYRLAILILLFCAPLAADDARVAALIGRLGDEQWEVRERAQRELTGMGEAARARLVAALRHDDLEIRARASSALIAIGESFAHAVECAAGDHDGQRSHGRAALANLFRIDDPQNLRALTVNEINMMHGGSGEMVSITAPPALALARLESITQVPLFVSSAARQDWQRVLSQGTLNLRTTSEPRQVRYLRDMLSNLISRSMGIGGLAFVPVRVGRADLLYIVTRAESEEAELGRRIGEQLVSALLADGPESVRAAALLAEGAATDSAATDRIRAEYTGNPGNTRLMWLALALGANDDVSATVRGVDAAPALALLDSTDWLALVLAARFWRAQEPARVTELLSPLIATSTRALAVTCALWCAQGSPLTLEARERAATLLTNREDAPAAAAVRWFARAGELSDEELDRIWTAAETRQPGSAFFNEALDLVSRPEFASRLIDRARAALAGVQGTQQALAAAVLAGRATLADLSLAAERLVSRTPGLAARLAQMFKDCPELEPPARKSIVDGLVHMDPGVRRDYLAALRACSEAERARIVAEWHLRVEEAFKEDEARVGRHMVQSRVHLWAFQARAGNGEALARLTALAAGEDAEAARNAGTALPDAMDEAMLIRELEALRAKQGVPHGAMVSAEAFSELCRRAVETADRASFRRFFGMAIAQQFPQNYSVRNELNQLQVQINRRPGVGAEADALPPGMVLNRLDLED